MRLVLDHVRSTSNSQVSQLTNISTVQPWSVTHGHFLQMGGFRVLMTPSELDEHQVPILYTTDRGDGSVEGVLTLESLKVLLREELIDLPSISEDEINDRSKGDALSKGIAFLQLTWFTVQIITRAAQGLAITELELTTAALAILNSTNYLFWWSKPLDVRFPIVIKTKGIRQLIPESRESVRWEFGRSSFGLRAHLRKAIINTVTCSVGTGTKHALLESLGRLGISIRGFIREHSSAFEDSSEIQTLSFLRTRSKESRGRDL